MSPATQAKQTGSDKQNTPPVTCELKSLSRSKYYKQAKAKKRKRWTPKRLCAECGEEAYYFCAAHSHDGKKGGVARVNFVAICGINSARGSACFLSHINNLDPNADTCAQTPKSHKRTRRSLKYS